MKNTFISDDIILKCFNIKHLTPNAFADVAHKLCDNNNLKNPLRNETIKDAYFYLKHNHPCFSKV